MIELIRRFIWVAVAVAAIVILVLGLSTPQFFLLPRTLWGWVIWAIWLIVVICVLGLLLRFGWLLVLVVAFVLLMPIGVGLAVKVVHNIQDANRSGSPTAGASASQKPSGTSTASSPATTSSPTNPPTPLGPPLHQNKLVMIEASNGPDVMADLKSLRNKDMGGIVWVGDYLASDDDVRAVLDDAELLSMRVVLDVRHWYGTPKAASFVDTYADYPAVSGVYYSFEHPLSPDNPGDMDQLQQAYDSLLAKTSKPLYGAVDWMAPDASVRQQWIAQVPGTPAVAFFPYPVDPAGYGPPSRIQQSAADLKAVGHGGVMIVQAGGKTPAYGFADTGMPPTIHQMAREIMLAEEGGVQEVWIDPFGENRFGKIASAVAGS
jgi:hypothetical protein